MVPIKDTVSSLLQVGAVAASATSTDTVVQIIAVIFNALITVWTIYARSKIK